VYYFYCMKTFVTGATGLVGAHIAYYLLKKGYSVRALRRATSSLKTIEFVFSCYEENSQALLNQIEWAEGDITDYYSIEDNLDGIDAVYHAAALVSYIPAEFALMEKINVEGTANIVNACMHKGIKKLGYVSSAAALGHDEHNSVYDEKTPWKQSPLVTHYGISKYNAEREVWRGVEEGLNAIIVNPVVVIGPGDWTKSSAEIIASVAKGLKFYTDNTMGFVDARDVAQATIQLMESDSKNERFVLCADNRTWQQVFYAIADGLGKPRPPYKAPEGMVIKLVVFFEKIKSLLTGKKPFLTNDSVKNAQVNQEFSSDKIKKALGYTFIPVEQSIKDAVAAYKKQ
jgi:dihydroflavonol-4-reductase